MRFFTDDVRTAFICLSTSDSRPVFRHAEVHYMSAYFRDNTRIATGSRGRAVMDVRRRGGKGETVSTR